MKESYLVLGNFKLPADKLGQQAISIKGQMIEMEDSDAAPFLKIGLLKSKKEMIKDKLDELGRQKAGHLAKIKIIEAEMSAVSGSGSSVSEDSKPAEVKSEVKFSKKDK